MNKIDELIKEKCSNGVEYKTLEQLEDSGVITLGRGKVISKKDIQDNPGEYPIYSSSAIGSGLLGTYGDYMFEDVRLSWSIDGGGKFFYRDAPKYSVTNVCGWLTVNKPEIMDIKYLFFALTNEWSKKVFDYVHKAHPSVIRKEYTIPIPPLEIQQEIVRMLNSFTELEAELTKRKQQYEHYRDHLLSFENIAGDGGQVEWLTLGDLCSISAGGDVPKDSLSNTKSDEYPIPIISNGIGENSLYGYTNQAKILKAAVTVSARGTIGYAEYRDYPYYPIVRLLSVVPNDEAKLNTKYLYYCLQGKKYKLPMSGIPQLTAPDLKSQKIPVPSQKIQERIVYVLDNFDTVCNDLKIGLPAEIEARQKQYEYYRDRLLSFDAVVGGGTERERERSS